MYLNHWRLARLPFENVPNSGVFFPSPQHEEALSRLLFAVRKGMGMAMLTGDVGSGKTTVARLLSRQLTANGYQVKTIINPAQDPLDFIHTIVVSLEPHTDPASKPILLAKLEALLRRNCENSLGTVLIVDEAHVIANPATFEELRMLLNLQAEDRFLITMVLIGQPPLRQKIAALQPLKERIGVRYHIDPLNFSHTVRYVLFRLKSAGAQKSIFTKSAVETVFAYSQGSPLRTNSVCDRSLLVGMLHQASAVDSAIVKEAIADLM
jgi:type II secretory pathway predicted ATPase ExeA